MMRRLSLCLLLAALASGVRAEPWQLVGEARLTFLFWTVYDSRLYTQDGGYSEGQRPLRLEVQYLLDVTAADLVERTREEWDHQGLRHPRREQWLQRLVALWPDIKAGDVLAIELEQSGASLFYHNGRELGRVDDLDFGTDFVAIWLSPQTSRPGLRVALIGEG